MDSEDNTKRQRWTFARFYFIVWKIAAVQFSLVLINTVSSTSDPTQSIPDCSGKPADVVFVLDTSYSIWRQDFRRQMTFVKDVISHFPVDSGVTRIGLLTYADRPRPHFNLGEFDRKSTILDAIDRIRHVGGYRTLTGSALRYMRESMFSPSHSNRTNVTRIGIVVTDGQSNDPVQTAAEALKTKDQGIHLFVIGVGKDQKDSELDAIASQPLSFYKIVSDDYSGLVNIKDLLAIKTCTVTNPTTTKATTTSSLTTAGHTTDSSTPTSEPSQLSDNLVKSPAFWRVYPNGTKSRLDQDIYTGSRRLPSISNGSTLSIRGQFVWSIPIEVGGSSKLRGRVINGSTYLGEMLSSDKGELVWWGYALVDGQRSTSGREGTAGLEDDDGVWLMDEAGRVVWYRYIGPGVYESSEGDAMSLETGEGDTSESDVTGHQPSSSSALQQSKGCQIRKPTELVFVLDAKSNQEDLVRGIWNVARDIVAEIDADASDQLKLRFVHECADAARLDLDLFSSKKDILKAVDDIVRTLPLSSSNLLEEMTSQLTRGPQEKPKRRRVGVYITDGKSKDFDKIVGAADAAKFTHNVEMFAIGIGDKVSRTELQAIASCPTEVHCYLPGKDFNAEFINDIAKKIGRSLCGENTKQ